MLSAHAGKVSQDGDGWVEVGGGTSAASPHPPHLLPVDTAFPHHHPATRALTQSIIIGNKPLKLIHVPSVRLWWRPPFPSSHAVCFMRTPGNNSCLASVWTTVRIFPSNWYAFILGTLWTVYLTRFPYSVRGRAAVGSTCDPPRRAERTEKRKGFFLPTTSSWWLLLSYLMWPHL